MPPEWLPLLQVVVGRSSDEEESSVIFELLGNLVEAGNEQVAPHIPHIVSLLVEATSKCITPNPEPWPQACAVLMLLILSLKCAHYFKSLS